MRSFRSPQTRLVLRVALLLGGLTLALGGVPLTQAGTITGTAVDISGVNDLTATADSYAKGNLGKLLGIGLATAGLLAMAGSHLGTGGLIAAAGVGLAFVPNMIGTAFDATSAAPLTGAAAPALLTAWWAPATAALYPVLLALRLVHDPVWVAALAAAWLRPRRHARATS
jgi:hypothetical protein